MSGTVHQFTDEYAQKKSQEQGTEILYSTPETLQIDLDSTQAFEQFEKQYSLLLELGLLRLKGYEVMESKSGNKHVVVKLDQSLSLKDRIMYQALLGSDPKREMLALQGMRMGQENPILLFRPKTRQLEEITFS